jgi:hypothetical protein
MQTQQTYNVSSSSLTSTLMSSMTLLHSGSTMQVVLIEVLALLDAPGLSESDVPLDPVKSGTSALCRY